MTSQVEYLFGPHISTADAFARVQGWCPYGRAQWLKRDGPWFISFPQLEIVSAGEIVHVIGRVREPLPVLTRLRTVTVCHD